MNEEQKEEKLKMEDQNIKSFQDKNFFNELIISIYIILRRIYVHLGFGSNGSKFLNVYLKNLVALQPFISTLVFRIFSYTSLEI